MSGHFRIPFRDSFMGVVAFPSHWPSPGAESQGSFSMGVFLSLSWVELEALDFLAF